MSAFNRFLKALWNALDTPDFTEDYRSNEKPTKKHYCPFDGYSGTEEDIRVHLLNRHKHESK